MKIAILQECSATTPAIVRRVGFVRVDSVTVQDRRSIARHREAARAAVVYSSQWLSANRQ
ncbi:MAG: hypothetical protein Fues2KO_27720 [Fuerstiella sp.]